MKRRLLAIALVCWPIAAQAAPALEGSPPVPGTPFNVRLGLVFAASPRTDTAAGSAEFYWFTARLGVGLFSLSRGPLSLRPTAGIGVGLVLGRGLAIAVPRDQVRLWFDVAFGARAQA